MPTNPPRMQTIPLFPLHYVLFPQFPIQLHIFEERYKQMISSCIEQDRPFGVMLIRHGGEVGATAIPHDVGCAARICDFVRADDGKMHVIAVGEHRFRLIEYSEGEMPYLVGRVEGLVDLPQAGGDLLRTEALRLRDMFLDFLEQVSARTGQPAPDLEMPDDATTLADWIAVAAQMPLPEKQKLLETVDVTARVRLVTRFVEWQRASLGTPEVAADAMEDGFSRLDLEGDRWSAFLCASRN